MPGLPVRALLATMMLSVGASMRAGISRVARATPRRALVTAAADGRICVVGGRFGGLHTALKLAALPWEGGQRPPITLIDRGDRHVFLPMLYDLTCGDVSEWEVAPRFDELLAGSGVEHVRAEMVSLDAPSRELVIKGSGGEQTLEYDKLVLALGARPIKPPSNGAMTFRSLDDALELRFKLRALLTSGAPLIRVVVVGASYSGIELAAQLARTIGPRRGLVTLVGRGTEVLRDGYAGSQAAASEALAKVGVELILCKNVQLEGPSRARLTDATSSPAGAAGDGEAATPPAPAEYIDADMLIWCAGSAPIPMTTELGLARAADGRIATTATLQVREQEHVYALRDMALCEPLGETDANSQNAQVCAAVRLCLIQRVGVAEWQGADALPLHQAGRDAGVRGGRCVGQRVRRARRPRAARRGDQALCLPVPHADKCAPRKGRLQLGCRCRAQGSRQLARQGAGYASDRLTRRACPRALGA
jgi:NADH dehydrogenase